MLRATEPEKPLVIRGNAKKVVEALANGPMTTAQIERATGLTTEQVRQVFRTQRGRSILSEPVKYRLTTHGAID